MSSVLPLHKATGKINSNAIDKDPRQIKPLGRHFEYLKILGKVQATRVVAMLVNGMINNVNCNATLDETYLPISMGFHMCYKWYMALLGYLWR